MKVLRAAVFILFVQTAVAQTYDAAEGWKYTPVNEPTWNEFENLRAKKVPGKTFQELFKRREASKNEIEKSEIEYAIALNCSEQEYYFCTYYFAINILTVSPGSAPAIASLSLLEELLQKDLIIEDEILRALNNGSGRDLPLNVVSMANYFVFRDNLKKGLKEWQKESLRKISAGSYWKYKLDYYLALTKVQKFNDKEALDEIIELEKNLGKYPEFLRRVQLQKARLLYGGKRYKEADSIYRGFLYSHREFPKILLERAWLKYFQKDYSLALGLLESLKSPFFQRSIHPEQYLLAMLIYRDLCHYDAVVSSYNEFQKVFNPSLEHLKSQKPLYTNDALMAMVLSHSDRANLSNMIGRIRLESQQIEEASLPKVVKSALIPIYKSGESIWKNFAQNFLDQDLKTAASEFVDYVEQIKLIEYISGLDKFRVRSSFENRQYIAPEANRFAIRKLFWPVSGEYWWEEMNSYQVLVSDKCEGGS